MGQPQNEQILMIVMVFCLKFVRRHVATAMLTYPFGLKTCRRPLDTNACDKVYMWLYATWYRKTDRYVVQVFQVVSGNLNIPSKKGGTWGGTVENVLYVQPVCPPCIQEVLGKYFWRLA